MKPGNIAGSDPAFNSAMRQMSRAAYADIWRRGISHEELSGEDTAFFQAMQLHPEYLDYWERAGELANREVLVHGVNPYLHVALHAVIERQITDRDPPEVDQALFRLTRAGIERHQAIHHILHVFTEFFWNALQMKVPMDNEKYRRRLRSITP